MTEFQLTNLESNFFLNNLEWRPLILRLRFVYSIKRNIISQKKTLKSLITLERPLTVTPFHAVLLMERTLSKVCRKKTCEIPCT